MTQEKAKKRKHAEEDPQTTKKVAKRPKRKPPIAPDDEEFDMDRQVYKTIAHMDGKLLADYHARQVKRFEPDLSLVELEDRRVPGMHQIVQGRLARHAFDTALTHSRMGFSRHNLMGPDEGEGRNAGLCRTL